MISVGIKDLKNQLSRYLSFVKQGEDVLITDRGKAVARIIAENSQTASLRNALQPLIIQGLIALPTDCLQRDIPDPIEVAGKPVSEMVLEDRR